jgi:hypothetical protein
VFVSNALRHWQKVPEREPQEFCVGPITSYDSEDSPLGAMARIACSTKLTFTAAGINFTDYSLTHHLATGSVFNDAYKFVTYGPAKASVAARDLNVSVADSGKQHTYNCFLPSLRHFNVANGYFVFLDSKGFHGEGCQVPVSDRT